MKGPNDCVHRSDIVQLSNMSHQCEHYFIPMTDRAHGGNPIYKPNVCSQLISQKTMQLFLKNGRRYFEFLKFAIHKFMKQVVETQGKTVCT